MKCPPLFLIVASAVVLAQSTESQQGYASLSAEIASLTDLLGITGSVPLPTVTIDMSTILTPPPSGVAQALLTAIPASVYSDLAIPSSRASLASDFKAGNTPSWYANLPSDVKSYINQIQAQATSINPSYGVMSANTTAHLTVTTQDPKATTGGDTGTAGTAMSTSKKGAAPVQTVGLIVPLLGGVLAVVAAL